MSKVLNPDTRVSRLIGRFRMLFGFCPRCSSDAPAVDSCSVCKQVYEDGAKTTAPNRRQCYPPNLATKALWWYTWLHPYYAAHQRDWERLEREKFNKRVANISSGDAGEG